MQRIDILKRKIKVAKDLQSIVKTMKGLAAVSISQYEHAVDSITNYYVSIEKGLKIVLKSQPHITAFLHSESPNDEVRRMAIIFGSGQPLCGAFNEMLAEYFHQHWDFHPGEQKDKIIVIGHRISSNLERRDRQIDAFFEMPTTVDAINETVQNLVLSIQQWQAVEEFQETYLFYNQPEPNAHYSQVKQQLLPVDNSWLQQLGMKPWEGRSLATYTMDAAVLASALIKQLLFVTIYKAFSESLSAENNSRLAAMQVAEKKIDEMIEDLSRSYRNQRQVNITEEIMDIMASFEVLKDDNEQDRFREP